MPPNLSLRRRAADDYDGGDDDGNKGAIRQMEKLLEVMVGKMKFNFRCVVCCQREKQAAPFLPLP